MLLPLVGEGGLCGLLMPAAADLFPLLAAEEGLLLLLLLFPLPLPVLLTLPSAVPAVAELASSMMARIWFWLMLARPRWLLVRPCPAAPFRLPLLMLDGILP